MTETTYPSRNFYRLPAILLATGAFMLTAGCHKKTAAPPASSMGPTIDANANAPTATLTASPEAIEAGQTSILNWRTTNATSVSIDGIGPVPSNGTQNASPSSSTTYHLIAKNDAGQTAEATVRVTVRVAAAPAPMGDTGGGGNMGGEAAFHQNVQDAFFDYDSYDLRPDASQAAVTAARYLNANPNIRVLIGGYADERGSAEYNLALGESRANSARTGLINTGVSGSRIRIVSYGKEKQFCTEPNESCWQQNRRAQFSLDR